MKIPVIFFALFFCPLLMEAQHQAIEKFYQQYNDQEKFTDLKLQGWVLKLAATFTDDHSSGRLLQKVTNLRLLKTEEGNPVTKTDFNKLLRSVKNDDFEELMKIKNGDNQVEFLIRDNSSAITDVLLMVHGQEEFIMLSLEGLFRFSDLNDLQHLDIEGSKHFRKIPEKKKDIPRA